MKRQYPIYRCLSAYALILTLLAANAVTVRQSDAQTTRNKDGKTFSNAAPTAPGDLDPTFGVGGKVIDASGYGAYDVAIQPDGKIVAVGLALGGSEVTQIAVARYNIDGSPDTTFGASGRVLIDHYEVAMDVAIQPDGKIVVAGRDPDGEVYGELIRLNSDGSLDTSFGTNGIMGPLFLPSVAATLPDGKLLINLAANLFRLNADGSFDNTFSRCRPEVTTVHYLYNRIESVVQPDGRILTAFTALIQNNGQPFGVFRCNADGTLDTTFGSGGVVITPLISSGLGVAQSIAMQPDGKIVIAGHSMNADWKLTVVRYNPNGSLDTGFGAGGAVTTPATGITYWNPPIDAVAIQTDGKIVVSATVQNRFALVRYDPNGSLDTTFGGGDGITTVDFNNSNGAAYGMALDSQGRAVVVGEMSGAFALARFLIDSPAAAVSVSGRVMTPDGRGLRNAGVKMTPIDSMGNPVGLTRTMTTSSFGFYTFDNVTVGVSYLMTVSSRLYRFSSRQIPVGFDNLTGVDFVGQE